jgi:hypothetical protein
MRRWFQIALLLPAVGMIAGCARGPANPERAKALASWVGSQSYSTWYMFRHRDKTPHVPPSPDGLTLGSPNVFAAIGCNPKDLTSLDVFWGDRRTVRPLAKPMAVSVREEGREHALADSAEQTLRRVRHTSISVSQAEDPDLRVTCVDFAPMGTEENFLARWFLVENTAGSARRIAIRLKVGAAGEWARTAGGIAQREDLTFISDGLLTGSGDFLDADLGRLRPGERAAAAILMIATKDQQRMDKQIGEAKAALDRLPALLEETKKNWEEWCGRTPLSTGDERTDDLLDSLLCLVRSHIGAEAIHTGSLRYPHNRAWVRDGYWVQRALLELGRREEARLGLDFFHRAWRTAGVASYYEMPSERSTAYGYGRVELPHYLVLMVRDAEQLGGVRGLDYWDMVKGCLDKAAVPESGLQPMNGDETCLLAAPVRELDDLLDNSWLLIASAEYGAKLAEQAGDQGRAARYGAMAYRARMALTKFQPGTGDPPWYAIGRGADGSLDFSLCPEVFARGVILGVLPAKDRYLMSGLVESWDRMNFDGGVRAHARSATISGGTPGYVLYAAAEDEYTDWHFGRELASRMLRFASATGCVWEFHDLYDPAWGGEKQRLWDSAVLLMGMVHALFDVGQGPGGAGFIRKPTPAVDEEAQPPPLFGAQQARDLLARAGPALILHDQSPEHAARLARELLRQRNQEYAIGIYPGVPPEDRSAIIISPSLPPEGWIAQPGYWLRKWEGPTQLWVRNGGDVYLDTDPLLWELLPDLMPERAQPLPYPDASLDLVRRHGERPSEQAEVTAVSGSAKASGLLKLAGGKLSLKAGKPEFRAEASAAEEGTVKLTVAAAADRAEHCDVAVTMPPGWWLVVARDMTGKWDRVEDPVGEIRLSDGGLRLVYSFDAGGEPISLTFDLARLKVRSP